ncbi:MAG: hypothetical protein HYW50_01775 [Candidatus Diapherotrites archaeon]|nr:hypothetical protein [Candidatus Diapherotrites archaeon]
MDYWNELVTKKSFEKMVELKRKKIDFVVIGGWAAWLWTKAHKSKDLDIIVSVEELQKLRQLFDLKKNDRLKKYEIKLDEIDIDIYVPFYSRLALPVEELIKSNVLVEGFKVVKPEELVVLKQGAEFERGHSEKGLKDRLDIMGLLLFSQMDFKKYFELLKKFRKENFSKRLVEIVQSFNEGEYLNLNPRELKLKKQEILQKIKSK